MRSERILVRPGINARGFITAVKDYKEPAVVEELAANSYDADASTVLVALDTNRNELHIVDDGAGFTRAALISAATLGGGDKRDVQYSYSKRPYLGAYGFGLKATVNIANTVRIESISEEGRYLLSIDWRKLDDALKSDKIGFELERESRPRGRHTGSHIVLELRNPTQDVIDQYLRVLGNLPDDRGTCRYYAGLLASVKREVPRVFADFGELGRLAPRWHRKRLIKRSDPSNDPDLQQTEAEEFPDREDRTVRCKVFFTGFSGEKVVPLKKGLRGIYVRIHGRLLKQSFDEQKYVYGISKWVKFAAGLRVELSIDWLRNEISLSREGLTFANPKLEEQFVRTVQRNIGRFIQPKLKLLEKRAGQRVSRKHSQREELARVRTDARSRGVRLEGVRTGFPFKPETDGELALVLANPEILRKIQRSYVLIDYNDQAPFDCMLFDNERRELIRCELEPTLMEFLQHKGALEGLRLVITWSLGKWRVGAKKRGKKAFFRLNDSAPKKRGWFRLLAYARENSRLPFAHFDVVTLEALVRVH